MSAEIRRLIEQWRKDAGQFAAEQGVPAAVVMITSMHADQLAALLQALPHDDPPAYLSGSTHPEFEVWWERFGQPLMGDTRLSVRDLAMSAWAAADYRARAFARFAGRTDELTSGVTPTTSGADVGTYPASGNVSARALPANPAALPPDDPPGAARDFLAEADRLIQEVRESEVMTAEDLAIRITASALPAGPAAPRAEEEKA